MHPFYAETMIRHDEGELRRRLARAELRRPRNPAPTPPTETVTLRLSRVWLDR